ncbi:MAG: hypothetical protein C0483_24255 [Pirellula sp.]|nr:hypothetical protein [Pirellula sp.]
MLRDVIVTGNRQLGRAIAGAVPSLILDTGDDACRRYVDWLAATIRNRKTREAYARAIRRFPDWCELHQVTHESHLFSCRRVYRATRRRAVGPIGADAVTFAR